MKLSISSTFIGWDALTLVTDTVKAVKLGKIPNTEISCIISTREMGDSSQTDQILTKLQENLQGSIPLVAFSARKFGRLDEKNKNDPEARNAYDNEIIRRLKVQGVTPDVNVMLGDMITRGSTWCRKIISPNLHPDIPLKMGGTEGIYWDVIGSWIEQKRETIGGMVHAAIPELDAGTAIAYFRLPARGIVNGVNLGQLWTGVDAMNENQLREFVRRETAKGSAFDNELFRALRQAEFCYETKLVEQALTSIAQGEIRFKVEDISPDKYVIHVLDGRGKELKSGLDITETVVDGRAIWPGQEGANARREQRQF